MYFKYSLCHSVHDWIRITLSTIAHSPYAKLNKFLLNELRACDQIKKTNWNSRRRKFVLEWLQKKKQCICSPVTGMNYTDNFLLHCTLNGTLAIYSLVPQCTVWNNVKSTPPWYVKCIQRQEMCKIQVINVLKRRKTMFYRVHAPQYPFLRCARPTWLSMSMTCAMA